MTYPDVRVYLDVTSAPSGPATTWVDVTEWVTGRVSAAWGRSSLRDTMSAGGGQFTLVNDDGRFDPFNAAGPYYPDLKPGARVEMRAGFPDVGFAEEFSSLGATWTTIGSGGVSISGGVVLSITPTGTTGTRGVRSTINVPFTSGVAFTVDPSSIPSTAPTNVTYEPMRLELGGGQTATWRVDTANGLSATRNGTILWSDAYQFFVHNYLRIRREGDFTLWETSSDNVEWTVRAAEATVWTDPGTCVYVTQVVVTGTAGATTVMQVNWVRVGVPTITFAHGWCQGFDQEQTYKNVSRVPVRFYDALTRLARASMPDSVWDYQIRNLDPLMWFQLGGETNVVEDHSSHRNHAVWEVVEGLEYEGTGNLVPDVVVEAGQIDGLIPMVDRPGTSWAKMYPELGQPLGGVTVGVPRSPIITTGTFGNFLGNYDATIECWVQFRQAFPLNLAGGVGAATTPIWQPIVLSGHEHNPQMLLGIDSDGDPLLLFGVPPTWARSGHGWTGANLFDGEPHHCVWAFRPVTSNLYVRLYVDGVAYSEVNFGMVFTPYQWPLTIGQPQWVDTATSLQSTLGDVVFYDGTLTASQVRTHYNAGKWGSLSTSTVSGFPTSGQLIVDALTMIGWTAPSDVDTGGQIVKPLVTGGRGALEYMRSVAESERGVLWQEPDGTLTFWLRNWPVTQQRAKTAYWRLADDGTSSSGLSYSQLDFSISEDAIITEAEVSWSGGKQRSESATGIAAHGRLRESVSTTLERASQAKDYADWLVFAHGSHQRVVKAPMVFEPNTQAEWSFALGARFGTRVTVVRTTPDGRTVEDDLWVQGVSHDFDAEYGGAWTTTVTFEPADEPARMWTWGESTWEGPDVFGY